MNNFTIIRQKLSLIFIIITFIISGLVFLNCVYNSLFVWYDNDNDVNLTDEIRPVSSMFGYKILSNSYVVNGTCTKYNNDIILTTNINTISFKIFKIIFTLYVMIIILTYFSQLIAMEEIEAIPFENTFYSEFKDIIILGIFSVVAMLIISNNFNNPGDNVYEQYNDIEETFESYLFAQYIKIIDVSDRDILKNIIKNTNKNNFNNEDDYARITKTNFGSSKDICLKFLELCKDLCVINKDTNVDVVKYFYNFLLNCQISDNAKNINKRYNIIKVTDKITEENKANANDIDTISEVKYDISEADIKELISDETKSALLKYDDNDYIKGKNENENDVYYQIKRYIEPEPGWIEKLFNNYIIKNIEYFFTDIKCVFEEYNFLKTNFNSIFELLAKFGKAINPFGEDDTRNYNTNVEEKSGMNIVLLTSLLTKDFLKKCSDDKRLHKNYGDYLQKMGEYAIIGIDDNKSFTSLMNEAKKTTYRDLFIIKGLVTGIIVFSFANIVLKRYYNIYHTDFLKSIDKNIVLYYIYGDRFNAFKYETIRRLLNANDYSLNVAISLIIIVLLLKPWGYPKDINLKCLP